jgi:hypothetical protein
MLGCQIIVHLCVHAFPHVPRQLRVQKKCENLADESQTQSMSVHMPGCFDQKLSWHANLMANIRGYHEIMLLLG